MAGHRFLAALAEHEIAERDRRRIERHLTEARLPPGKTLDTFDFTNLPMISKAHIMALCVGDSSLEKGANLIMVGRPGGGKSHLAAAIGMALIEAGWRVLFTRTSDLVQKLQVARRELALETKPSALAASVRWISREDRCATRVASSPVRSSALTHAMSLGSAAVTN